MEKPTRTIAVTGMNAHDNPGPGVAVARALREAPDVDYRIVGLAYDALEPGNFADDIVDAVYMIPYPSQGRDALLERLRYIHAQTPLDAILPTLDAELPLFIDLEEPLESLNIGILLPSREQFDLRSKAKLSELRKSHEINVIRSKTITTLEQLYNVHQEISFPFYVKGVFYGAHLCHNIDEATQAFHHVTAKWGFPVIVQESVVGEEVNVAVVGDGEGGTLGAIPMKKTYRTEKGKGWAGIVIQNPDLMAMAERFIAAVKWRGPCELEVIVDRDDQLHLLEVNPRFPAWIYLSAGAGINLPHRVAQLAAGAEPDTSPEYEVGTMFVRISLDRVVRMTDYQALTTMGELIHETAPNPKKEALT